MTRVLWGFIISAIGILITMKAEWLYQTMGPVPFAESRLGAEGGSRLWYKLIGIVVTIIGFLMITNLLGNIVLAIFGPLFRGFQ